MQTLAFSRLPPQQLVLVLAPWPLLPELETALLTTSASLSGPSSAPRGGRASWNPGKGPRRAAEVLSVCPGLAKALGVCPGPPHLAEVLGVCPGPPHLAEALGVCPGPLTWQLRPV